MGLTKLLMALTKLLIEISSQTREKGLYFSDIVGIHIFLPIIYYFYFSPGNIETIFYKLLHDNQANTKC